MKTWAWMTVGLVIWAVHFTGVYTISSVADVVAAADSVGWRMSALAFSGFCALSAAAVCWAAFRRLRGRRDAFADQIAALGSGVAVIAIVWQALPIIIGH